MIYLFLRQLFKLAIRVYFRKTIRQFRHTLPADGPLVILANHNSAIMDAILLGVLIDRPLHFLSRGESFDKAWKRWLWSLFHMIPIYRREFTPDLVKYNDDIFAHCGRLLKQGKALLIFPEGKSKLDKRLGKVKTGAARILLGAAAKSNYSMPITVVPLGIDYSNPHRFRSEVVVRSNGAIDMNRFYQLHRKQPEAAIRALTEQVKQSLEEMICLDGSAKKHLSPQQAKPGRPSYFPFIIKELVVAYAYLNHCWMLKSTQWLANRTCRRRDFYGTLLLSLGTLIFLVGYSVQVILVYGLTASVSLAFIYLLSLIGSGWLALQISKI